MRDALGGCHHDMGYERGVLISAYNQQQEWVKSGRQASNRASKAKQSTAQHSTASDYCK